MTQDEAKSLRVALVEIEVAPRVEKQAEKDWSLGEVVLLKGGWPAPFTSYKPAMRLEPLEDDFNPSSP